MKQKLFMICVAVILLVCAAYLSIPFILAHSGVTEKIAEAASRSLGREITVGSVRLKTFPYIGVALESVSISEDDSLGAGTFLKADNVSLHLDIIPLFSKRLSFGDIRLSNGELYYRKTAKEDSLNSLIVDQAKSSGTEKEVRTEAGGSIAFKVSRIHISDFKVICQIDDGEGRESESVILAEDLVAKSISDNDYSIDANVSIESAGRISLKGTFNPDYSDFLNGSTFDLHFDVKSLQSSGVLPYLGGGAVSLNGRESVSGMLDLKRETPDGEILLSTDISFANVMDQEKVYLLAGGSFDLEKLNLVLTASSLRALDSEISVTGNYDLKESLFDLHLRSASLRASTFKGLFPDKFEKTGLLFGDADAVSLDLVIKGDSFSQQLRGSVDFSAVDVGYKDIWRKSAGRVLSFSVDIGADEFKRCRGAFNILSADMNLKGDIQDFDLQMMKGSFNFLTDKFAVNQQVSSFPVYGKGLEVSGFSKISLSAEGDFSKPKEVVFTAGVTLIDLNVTYNEKVYLEKCNSYIKINQSDLAVESFNSLLFGNEAVLNLIVNNYMKTPEIEGEVFLKRLDLDSVMPEKIKKQEKPKAATSVSSKSDVVSKPESISSSPEKLESQIFDMVPALKGNTAFLIEDIKYRGETVGPLQGIIRMDGKTFMLEEGSLDAFDGSIKLKGVVDLEKGPYFSVTSLINEINIEKANRFACGKDADDYIAGLLNGVFDMSASGTVPAEIIQSLEGKGKVSINSGQFKYVDIFKALSMAKQLLGIKDLAGNGTQFDNFSSVFTVDEGALNTTDIQLNSPDFNVSGNGALYFDGKLDFDLIVMLSSALSAKMLSLNEGQQFKLPVQIKGSMKKPSYSVSSAIIQSLVNDLVSQGLERLFKVKEESQSASGSASKSGSISSPIESDNTGDSSSAPIGSSSPIGSQTSGEGGSQSAISASRTSETKTREDILEDVVRQGLGALLRASQE